MKQVLVVLAVVAVLVVSAAPSQAFPHWYPKWYIALKRLIDGDPSPQGFFGKGPSNGQAAKGRTAVPDPKVAAPSRDSSLRVTN
ncbi:MAG: hypothetical protein ACKVW3_01785 [Phycisphaerales bacterium]